jgi:hypothetical protein
MPQGAPAPNCRGRKAAGVPKEKLMIQRDLYGYSGLSTGKIFEV